MLHPRQFDGLKRWGKVPRPDSTASSSPALHPCLAPSLGPSLSLSLPPTIYTLASHPKSFLCPCFLSSHCPPPLPLSRPPSPPLPGLPVPFLSPACRLLTSPLLSGCQALRMVLPALCAMCSFLGHLGPLRVLFRLPWGASQPNV